MSINNFWLFSILFNYFVNCGSFQNNKKHYKSFKNDTFKISFDITNNINSFLEEKDKKIFNLVNKKISKDIKNDLKLRKDFNDLLSTKPHKEMSYFDSFLNMLLAKPLIKDIDKLYTILSTKTGKLLILEKGKDPIQNQKLRKFAIKNHDIHLLNVFKSMGIKMELSKVDLVDIILSLENDQHPGLKIKVFLENYIDQKQRWKHIIRSNDIKKLKHMKSTGVKMELSNNELVKIIDSFYFVSFYETIQFLIDHIILDYAISYHLMTRILLFLTTPNSKQQQNIQFEIFKKLIEYRTVKNWLTDDFDNIILSLNIPLLDFVVKILNININGLFYGKSVLQTAIIYLKYNPNINTDLACEMFEHLIIIGADINKKDKNGRNVYYFIKQITDHAIQEKLNKIISKHLLNV